MTSCSTARYSARRETRSDPTHGSILSARATELSQFSRVVGELDLVPSTGEQVDGVHRRPRRERRGDLSDAPEALLKVHRAEQPQGTAFVC